MALPKSQVEWINAEIEKALPTNTTGGITAEDERDLLHKMAEKLDPLPYVEALKAMVADDLEGLREVLLVRIAEVDNKADNTNQVVASHTGEIGVLQKTTGDMAATIAALEQRVAALEGAVPSEAE